MRQGMWVTTDSHRDFAECAARDQQPHLALSSSSTLEALQRQHRMDPDSPAFTVLDRRETFFEEALVSPVTTRRVELVRQWSLGMDDLLNLGRYNDWDMRFARKRTTRRPMPMASGCARASLFMQMKPVLTWRQTGRNLRSLGQQCFLEASTLSTMHCICSSRVILSLGYTLASIMKPDRLLLSLLIPHADGRRSDRA